MKYSFEKAKKKAEQKKRSHWYIFEKSGWKCLFFLAPLIPFAKLSERIKTKNIIIWSGVRKKPKRS